MSTKEQISTPREQRKHADGELNQSSMNAITKVLGATSQEIDAITRQSSDMAELISDKITDDQEVNAGSDKLKSLIPLTRAVDLHNDPKYDSLYSHQQIFQDILIKNYGSKPEVIAKIESILPDIDKIKFSMMPLKTEEQQLNIKHRSIVHGDQPGNDADKGADGVSYARNEGYKWGTDAEMDAFDKHVDDTIQLLMDADASEPDAIRLIVLRLGLGKCGGQDSDGQFYNLGRYGTFVYSRVRGGKVHCFNFSVSYAGRDWNLSKNAGTIVRN